MKAVPRQWLEAWPEALAAWSAHTLLRDPLFVAEDADEYAMRGQIAGIRLHDNLVMVNTETIASKGLEAHGLAILAHEVGHHVYVPGNLALHARCFAAIREMLTGLPDERAHLVANLYADLLINDRLQRRVGLDMAGVYRALRTDGSVSRVWALYTRTYEHLWRLRAGELGPSEVDERTDTDALLLAELVRSYGGDWLDGARRFAVVLYPYLVEDEEVRTTDTFLAHGLADTRHPAGPDSSVIPDGLAGIGSGGRGGQSRSPHQYRELLEALGVKVPEHEITARFYRERALPHLLPFPTRRRPGVTEPLAEGWTTWEAGDPVDALDILGTVAHSPLVVPGVTTVQRVYGESPGQDPRRDPVDLDIYVDCSGSMPDPASDLSYLALAGTILALSALRAGARVQATLWSGPGQIDTTSGFIRDEKRLMQVITGYISGGTSFPVDVLDRTFRHREPGDPPVHVVVISDDGVDTILRGEGEAVCQRVLEVAAGATLVLNLPSWRGEWRAGQRLGDLGFALHAVTDWEELVAFARAFARETYGEAP